MTERNRKKTMGDIAEHVRTGGAIGIWRGDGKDAEEIRGLAAARSTRYYNYQTNLTTTDFYLTPPSNKRRNIGRAVVGVKIDPSTSLAIEIDVQVA